MALGKSSRSRPPFGLPPRLVWLGTSELDDAALLRLELSRRRCAPFVSRSGSPQLPTESSEREKLDSCAYPARRPSIGDDGSGFNARFELGWHRCTPERKDGSLQITVEDAPAHFARARSGRAPRACRCWWSAMMASTFALVRCL